MLEQLKKFWLDDTGAGMSSHATSLVKIGLAVAGTVVIVGGLYLIGKNKFAGLQGDITGFKVNAPATSTGGALTNIQTTTGNTTTSGVTLQ